MTVHGLAATIRSATESETFDLGGQNATAISHAISEAFREPLDSLDNEECEMIRITFVVGAGKGNRQKYDDGAFKAVTSELAKLGYREDRASSCVAECGGTFKMQHDTGKNLKTVVVFPRISRGKGDGAGGGGSAEDGGEEPPLIPENSPGWKIAACSMNVFRTMIERQCPSWSQKKGCVGCIEALKEMMADIEAKLMKGTQALDGPEQSFYDAVSDLDEKESYVRNAMHEQVERGDVTKYEKDHLLEHNAERIRSLEKEGKSTAKALQRKELLENIDPVPPPPLRLDAEIRKLHRELTPLLQLEARARGRLLTVEETRHMARKDEIVEEIEYLEERSRGWFEEDDVFEMRLRASRAVFEAKRAKKAAAANNRTVSAGLDKVAAGTSASGSKWVLPGQGGKGGRRRTGAAQRPRGKLKGSDVFSAMMMDSDSSSEEEDDDERSENESEGSAEEEGVSTTRATEKAVGERKAGNDVRPAPKPTQQQSQPAASKKSKKKKKKNKKKAKQQTGGEAEEPSAEEGATGEGAAAAAVASRAAPEANEEEGSAATATALVQQAFDFVATFVIPLVIGFITFLIALVFGGPKKRGGRGGGRRR